MYKNQIRPFPLTHIAAVASALLCALTKPALAVGIVPDGSTATSVSTAANGRQTVAIAPAAGGVSSNTYRSFNVSAVGADLNNTGINARTIVNQVTSTNPSLIQGAVNVLGSRANVILANPNGITVDGGSFVNAGHVVLSTGQVSFSDITLAPGQIQRDVVLTTNGGAIIIGAGGLTGTLINLDLVSKQLAVNGPVTNDYSSSTGGIRAITGNSTTTWDTGLSPSDNGHDWLVGLTSPGVPGAGYAVDITQAGGLTAGRVQLIVTDQGAGVRSAGTLNATAGDAVVQANGDITIAGGSVTAANDVTMTTPGAVSVQGTPMTAGSNANVTAGTSIAVAGGAVESGNATTLNAQGGPMTLQDTKVTASQDVSLTATEVFSAQGSQVLAGQDVSLQAMGITLSADGNGASTVSAGRNATLASSGDLTSTGSTVKAGNDTAVSAAGAVTLQDAQAFAANDLSLDAGGALSMQGGQIGANHNATLQAAGITVSDDASGPATVRADNALALKSAGDISDTGSLIQAGVVQPDGSLLGGDLMLDAGGSITNRSDATNLGILFSANGQVLLTAQGDITNDNARILANGGISLAAQGDVNNVIDHSGGVNGGTPVAYSDEGGGFLFFQHQSSGFNVDYGTVNAPDQLAYIASSAGPVAITGRNVTNSGGMIEASNGDVNIIARDAFTNAAVFAGQASYSQSCFILCHGSASSSVTPYGGSIMAGGDMTIKAGTSAANIGGNVYAHGDLTVDAPLTYATGVTGYLSINQDRGFKAFFGSTWAQLIAMDIGGGFTADGLVTLTGDAIVNGGYISGGQGVRGQLTTLRAPSRTPVQIGQHLGLTTWLWF
ncbi:filamentous hemagglutinin family protein [Paraburkholderia sp. RAU2J]|uniref:two-partner secretion domain-containing protein n=1 Tax=Paraburkholderia sp. RAU2J TaxID=1938810 RepID=UPI000EACB635|nr:filamentous hemagglutinin N-terminal domain-containing protein [Paraburkholderia sp. RAU2J]RKT25637.1 filamentous hemagglutinin family protein [Paraburkholderia sp. RAU2J]